MKRTFLDKLIGLISPEAENRRIQARLKLRAYDVAQTFPSSEWTSSNKNSANTELKAAIAPGRQKARTLVQNAPYGTKAVDVIVAETVGAGIVPNISGKNSTQTKKLRALWKTWADTTACDYEARNNYYGLQELAFRSTVESGEGLGLKKFDATGPKIQILEPDFIATAKDEGNVIQGIEINKGLRTKYHILKTHPGDKNSSDETYAVPAANVIHVYRQKRAGQVRGITWAHAIVEKMKDFDDYQYATLVRQKIAACFGGFITTDGKDSLLPAADLKAKRESEMSMEPNTWRYLSPGEDVKLISPPGVDGYGDFNRETLRAVAAGWGISYEALTGDYSQSNYSSSRMGQLQMRKNIEAWRWNMFIPQFCEPTFKWFLEWAAMQGIDTTGVTVKWVPPAYTMIDPSKEIASVQKEVRSGFKSFGEALLEQGRDPDEVLAEIAEWNKKFDDAKVTLDIDPRRMSQIGFAQAGESLGKLSPDADYIQDKPEEGSNASEETNEATSEPDSSDSK